MRLSLVLAMVTAISTASGCAGLATHSKAGGQHRLSLLAAPAEDQDDSVALAGDDRTSDREVLLEAEPEPETFPTLATQSREQIDTPSPEAGELGEGSDDRFTRTLAEVPLSIQPPPGVMPGNLVPLDDETLASPDGPRSPTEIWCGYSPWTICYRPLYFEEIDLERYGVGRPCCLAQSAVSGARFFTNFALLPYKMVLQPPRSCVCSNGFSRCGDPEPYGYRCCVLRADAAVTQAVVVVGIAAILP